MPIQQFATARGIKHLFHFTQLGNLPSILANGLLPTNHLDANRVASIRNDQQRIDGTTGICLSISFPNYKLFYPFRLNTPDTQWVVLAIKPNVLWEKDCAFCRQNAAKAEVTNIPLNMRKTLPALHAMFDDFPGVPRASLAVPENYPTHPQAEILVFEPIPPQDIVAIIFNDQAVQRQYKAMNLQQQIVYNTTYFSARRDFDKWKANG
ncbi:hypothetical protein VM94_04819 [Janthinobacterium sp. KBS0711]|uniref:DarT ssDNA thymidine ADP-ribosyltransferase family protein n=1 Tax=Janthinobacterium sp. KBS0711 TaxID=1649647 RepID=UPI0006367C91|nr:DarT ssDNA thymidine ADP-ribosyltransferase family protein [Janthinobacterium sp. KBS0711]KKO61049.1 hypothetical protein VM94_04819 [Janthinobacterium sp. KBS0711]TSD73297.1 DUF4433 domain-containing protein [Janthinobacterium sp. KBS0711]